MSLRRITLIDGEFLRGLCEEYGKLVEFDFFKRLNWASVSQGAQRTFFYDSLPARRSNQSEEEFEAEYQDKISSLNHIRSQRWYHVRDGVSRYRQRDRRREQKGVDILLAIDAVQMASQNLADEIRILTSDTDFFPVFEAMNSTRCRGVLRYQRGRASEELIYSADEAIPIEIRDLAQWCDVSEGHNKSIFPERLPVDVLPDTCPEFLGRPSQESCFLHYDEATGVFEYYSWAGNSWRVARDANIYRVFELANANDPFRYPYERRAHFAEMSKP